MSDEVEYPIQYSNLLYVEPGNDVKTGYSVVCVRRDESLARGFKSFNDATEVPVARNSSAK